jgi:hypothetical protein
VKNLNYWNFRLQFLFNKPIVIKADPANKEYLLVSGCIKYVIYMVTQNINYDEKKIDTVKAKTLRRENRLVETHTLNWKLKINMIKAKEQKQHFKTC